MAKFIYLYRGPATPTSDGPLEQGAERIAAFGAWMDKLGPALVDVGSPFGASASVRGRDLRAAADVATDAAAGLDLANVFPPNVLNGST